jgi:CBS domain-containing protein
MRLYNILREKGQNILSIEPGKTVKEAIDTLVEHNIGALLVVDNNKPAGIISERDILRLCSKSPEALYSTRISDIMTKDLIVGKNDDEVEETMAVLTEAHIRHLPVMDGDRIAGMISIGDLVKSQMHERTATIVHLRDYIAGNTR